MKLPIIQKFKDIIFVITSIAYILVRGDITVKTTPATQLPFRNCAPFTKCIIKNGGTTTGDAADLDLVMPKYKLIECS